MKNATGRVLGIALLVAAVLASGCAVTTSDDVASSMDGEEALSADDAVALQTAARLPVCAKFQGRRWTTDTFFYPAPGFSKKGLSLIQNNLGQGAPKFKSMNRRGVKLTLSSGGDVPYSLIFSSGADAVSEIQLGLRQSESVPLNTPVTLKVAPGALVWLDSTGNKCTTGQISATLKWTH